MIEPNVAIIQAFNTANRTFYIVCDTYFFLQGFFKVVKPAWVSTTITLFYGNSPNKMATTLDFLDWMDFFMWGYLKGRVYESRYNTIQESKDAVHYHLTNIQHTSLSKTTGRILTRARTCIQ